MKLQQVVPVPARMQALPMDKRGFPIPWNVWRDTDGDPHFTINDTEKTIICISELRCPLCGDKLLEDETDQETGMWFVGGPMSALVHGGSYIDQPGHEECVKYALKVCPYLAAPHYGKRIDDKTVDPEKAKGTLFMDGTMIPERPAFFVLVHTFSYYVTPQPNGFMYLKPIKPYIGMEFWRQGEPITKREAKQLLRMKTAKD